MVGRKKMVGGMVKASAGFLTDVKAAQISGTRFMKVKIVSAKTARLVAHRVVGGLHPLLPYRAAECG